mgnify:FL=1
MSAAGSAGPVIGVYGGSFDPVHRGHLTIARRALAQVPCDEVWFVPAARSPFKPAGAQAAARDRVDLLEAALADEERMRVCTVELDHPGRRSVDTVRSLREDRPEAHWRWIMGEDAFDDLPHWAEPEIFVALAPPVVQPRPGIVGERPATFAGAPVTWLEGEEIDVSSTAIRERLARGERPDDLHPRVLDLIEADRKSVV